MLSDEADLQLLRQSGGGGRVWCFSFTSAFLTAHGASGSPEFHPVELGQVAAPRSSSRRAASGSAVRCRPAGRSGVSAHTVTVGPSLAAGGPSAANEFDRLLGVGPELPRRRSCPVSAGGGGWRPSSTRRGGEGCLWGAGGGPPRFR